MTTNQSTNNAPDAITLDLNVFDGEGNVVGGATATLTVAQLSDVVDHASQLILMRRSGQSFDAVLDELDEALSAADVLEAAEESTASAPSKANDNTQAVINSAQGCSCRGAKGVCEQCKSKMVDYITGRLLAKELVVQAFALDNGHSPEFSVPRWATVTCGPDLIRKLSSAAATCHFAGPELEYMAFDDTKNASLRPGWDGAKTEPSNTRLCISKDAFWFSQTVGKYGHVIHTLAMSIQLLKEKLVANTSPRIFHSYYISDLEQEFEDNEDAIQMSEASELSRLNEQADTPSGN